MRMRLLALVLCLCTIFGLCGCAVSEEYRFVNPTESYSFEITEPPQTSPTEPEPTVAETAPPTLSAGAIASGLSDEDLVAQLFLVKCPVGGPVDLLEKHHIGGLVLFDSDVIDDTPDSLRQKLNGWQEYAPIPLLVAVDEEGGCVSRLSSNPNFRSEPFGRIRDIYYEGGLISLRQSEAEKAQLLRRSGINVNLAPVCDVVSEENGFMASRSLFQTAKITGNAIAAMVETMQQNQVGAVLKHFPGYGNLSGDTHTGEVLDTRSKEFLEANDFVPFRQGIQAGAGAVMVGHSIVRELDAASPASLSAEIHRILREELGFNGVIMTDDLMMGAITKHYDEGEAAVQAVLAGNDLLLTAWSEHQYDAVLEALQAGRISRDALVASATRVIQWKMDLGLL